MPSMCRHDARVGDRAVRKSDTEWRRERTRDITSVCAIQGEKHYEDTAWLSESIEEGDLKQS